ncbi:tetratricopeptide repeat protein [Risungbinella massiliensis]|uniref:tetratricopeptide repeat protein n=1 Tax=Risungbinella massiliensis TaxID=1329796 RepID=UPI00069B0163|nr:tetratricopeptide repeat protein [Risungbinella massiliensis]
MTTTPIQAVLFDLDGTIIDSEPVYFQAECKLLKEHGIHDFTFEAKQEFVGRSTEDMIEKLKQRYPQLTEPTQQLVDRVDQLYQKLAKTKTVVFPEMKKFLRQLRDAGYPTAIASGSTRKVILDILEITGLTSCFDLVVSSEEVAKGKPAPDVFLEAANRLCVDPRACLVLEDTHFGVIAAKKANMRCIAIPAVRNRLAVEFEHADILYRGGIAEFSADVVMEWVQTQSTTSINAGKLDWEALSTLQEVQLLISQGNRQEALSLAIQLQKQYPSNPEVLIQCAYLHDSLGLEKEAVPFYERAIQLGLPESELPEAMLGLGSTYRVLGEYKKAADILTRAQQQFPHHRAIQVFRSMALYNLGSHQDAMEILLTSLADTSTDQTIQAYQKAIRFYAKDLSKIHLT